MCPFKVASNVFWKLLKKNVEDGDAEYNNVRITEID